MNEELALKILNLEKGVSSKEIKDAYILLKKLYSEKDNIITISLEEEFLKNKRNNILSELEEAYMLLIEKRKDEIKSTEKVAKENKIIQSEKLNSLSGDIIRIIREKNNIDLEEISLSTNIKKQYLKDIEEENFSDLPPRVFLKGYLKELSRYLNFDENLINTYLSKYDDWLQRKS